MKLIGCLIHPISQSPFCAAPLVIQRDNNIFVAQGLDAPWEPMNQKEWRDVLISEEATALFDPINLNTGDPKVWMFRSNFSFRDEAIEEVSRRKTVFSSEIHGTTVVLVVDGLNLDGLRRKWMKTAWEAAWMKAKLKQWNEAIEDAELSYSLSPLSLETHIAFLSVLYEMNRTDGEAMLVFAQNSYGDQFFRRTLRYRDIYKKRLS